jgi:RNase P subunit RPR2
METRDRRRFRGLKQFKGMSDEEFNDYWDSKEIEIDIEKSRDDFENRIEEKIAGFEIDYDLSDMKFNDRETLRGLCQALIQLEDLEQAGYALREGGVSFDNLTLLDKLAQQMSRTRLDMLKMQEDLKISRKVRTSDKNLGTISELEDLKRKAKIFYEQKMRYIFCPKCNMLLATAWFLFNDADNTLRLECQRVLDTGEKCGHVFDVKSKDIIKKGSNRPEIMPEAMR